MINVLVLAQVIRPGGGPGGYAWNLEQGIRSLSDVEATDVCFRFEGARDERSSPKLSGRRFKLMTFIRNILEVVGLRGMLLWVRFNFSRHFRALRDAVDASDVIVAHGPFFLDVLRYANRKKKRTIYMPHSPVIYADEYRDTLLNNGIKAPHASYRIRFEYEQDCIDNASILVFPSEGASEEYFNKFEISDVNKVRYLASGVDVDHPVGAAAKEFTSDIPAVFFAGRYVDHKGFADFCQAADVAASRNVHAKFLCAGAGPLVAPTSVQDLGWRSDIHSLVRQAQLVVIPNRVAYYDLFPLECAALGKPMVMSLVGGNVDQAKLLPDIVTYSPEDDEALLTAIATALQKISVNPHWGAGNLTCYEAAFTSTSMARRWVALIKSI